jgi:dynactin 1
VTEPAPPAPRAQSPDPQKAAEALAAKHELDELRIKLRLLEQRKAEDMEKIRALEGKAAELETMRSARVKLQGKSESHGSAPDKRS